jgi:uncharacterized protein (DUF952 family)
MHPIVYKIMNEAQWIDFELSGVFAGASIDRTDGYIHLSTESQMGETAARYFSGQTDLMLVAVAVSRFGDTLKYEISRGGDQFPHLYGQIRIGDVLWAKPLPVDAKGQHIFPATAA